MAVVIPEEEYQEVLEDLARYTDDEDTLDNCYIAAINLVDDINDGLYNLFHWNESGEIMYGLHNFDTEKLVDRIESPKANNKSYGLAMRFFKDIGCIDSERRDYGNLWSLDTENTYNQLQTFSKIEKVMKDNEEELRIIEDDFITTDNFI